MELHERLQEARRAAGYDTAADAARRFSWNVNTYSSNENGNRAFSRTKAIDYAKAFKVDLEWLLTGKGDIKANLSKEQAEVINILDHLPPSRRSEFLRYGRFLQNQNDEDAG